MKPLADFIRVEIERIKESAKQLGVNLEYEIIQQDPHNYARYEALYNLIEKLIHDNGQWNDNERLIVFTEYKTTLDYLLCRLRKTYSHNEDRILCLFGGMDDVQRDLIKDAFNDPAAKVRVLLATDAAAEGLNLQSTARYILHYDCPWNPSRFEQRNGRLDRHGQARDVHVFHFASEQAADLKFLSYVISKVDQIREDLGAVGELFDEAIQRHLIRGEDFFTIKQALEVQIELARKVTDVHADNSVEEITGNAEKEFNRKIEVLAGELDLDPISGHETLEAALAIEAGRPQLSEPDDLDRFSLLNPNLPSWKDTVDEVIRKKTTTGTLGPVPKLSFSTKPFIAEIAGRRVFRPRTDTLMLHLGHPLIQRATGCLTRRRFPGPGAVSRWSVQYGEVPKGADALILLHVEEMAVNELRETFHHWIRTIQLPVANAELGQPLPHVPAIQLRQGRPCQDEKHITFAQNTLDELESDLRRLVNRLRTELTNRLLEQLAIDGKEALKEEDSRYQSRQGEVSSLIAENTLTKLEREIQQLKHKRLQGVLFESESYFDELDRSIDIKQEELDRRRHHYEEVRDQLARERERIIKYVLPRRYALQGEAQVFPVAVEIRLPLPEGARE